MEQRNIKIWDETPGYDYIAEIDLPEMHSWFLDKAHSIPPLTPLCAWQWARYSGHGLKVACAELSIPACKGWELRILNGGIYCAFKMVRDRRRFLNVRSNSTRHCNHGLKTLTVCGLVINKSY